ncbi:ATP-binding protein [Blastochloris viridis]|uniref:ATP-binding protein n=1 Tax=Blastochloris viridis TaxID=1079 RepID=UPI0022B26B15|nr:ATP-binding protein [Blastochloris viridis]
MVEPVDPFQRGELDGLNHTRFLLRLVEREILDRERRVTERRIRRARSPATKSFDTFDFTAMPSINKTLVGPSDLPVSGGDRHTPATRSGGYCPLAKPPCGGRHRTDRR